MIITILVVLGLAFGSFVNALVWRLHEQSRESGETVKDHQGKRRSLLSPFSSHLSPKSDRYSIVNGRSMCPHCKHELSALDLVPVLSWLALRGKCRYCKKPISWQYPLVELITAGLYVASYIFWPWLFDTVQYVSLGLWLVILTGLIALAVYDLHWRLLPNRIVFPLQAVAAARALLLVANDSQPWRQLGALVLSVAIGGGIFYLLFQVSNGKWIGGGDVKLGFLLGLVVLDPFKAFLVLFLASILGTVLSLPLLAAKQLKTSSHIPFGPFLIAAGIIAVLWGSSIIDWYQQIFIM